jgi:TRAP-type uncharacterized transport system substrate-binding protein
LCLYGISMELFLVYLAVAAIFFIYFYYDNLRAFNPFIKEYYLAKERVITFATGSEENINYEFGNYLNVLMKEHLKRVGYFKVNVSSVVSNAESIEQTNIGNTDFGIATEYTLSKANTKNIRYICSLYDANVLILSDNRNTRIFDFNDLEGSSIVMHIGPKGSLSNSMARQVMALCGIPVERVKIAETPYDTLVEDYGKSIRVVFLVSVMNNDLLLKLTNSVSSHFITLNKLNNGNLYSKTAAEIQIYKENPYLHKTLISYQNFFKMYPALTRLNERQHYIPSIKTRYVLFSNSNLEEDIGYFVLKTIVEQLHSLEEFIQKATLMDISFSLLPLEMDKGARKFYKEQNIIVTSEQNPDCIYYINGAKCPEDTMELTGRLVDINAFNVNVF